LKEKSDYLLKRFNIKNEIKFFSKWKCCDTKPYFWPNLGGGGDASLPLNSIFLIIWQSLAVNEFPSTLSLQWLPKDMKGLGNTTFGRMMSCRAALSKMTDISWSTLETQHLTDWRLAEQHQAKLHKLSNTRQSSMWQNDSLQSSTEQNDINWTMFSNRTFDRMTTCRAAPSKMASTSEQHFETQHLTEWQLIEQH